jgi:hypothetical protein
VSPRRLDEPFDLLRSSLSSALQETADALYYGVPAIGVLIFAVVNIALYRPYPAGDPVDHRTFRLRPARGFRVMSRSQETSAMAADTSWLEGGGLGPPARTAARRLRKARRRATH